MCWGGQPAGAVAVSAGQWSTPLAAVPGVEMHCLLRPRLGPSSVLFVSQSFRSKQFSRVVPILGIGNSQEIWAPHLDQVKNGKGMFRGCTCREGWGFWGYFPPSTSIPPREVLHVRAALL